MPTFLETGNRSAAPIVTRSADQAKCCEGHRLAACATGWRATGWQPVLRDAGSQAGSLCYGMGGHRLAACATGCGFTGWQPVLRDGGSQAGSLCYGMGGHRLAACATGRGFADASRLLARDVLLDGFRKIGRLEWLISGRIAELDL
jgi:hypothetical protein